MSVTTIIKSIKTTNNLDIPNVVTEVQYSIRKNNASVDGYANLSEADFFEMRSIFEDFYQTYNDRDLSTWNDEIPVGLTICIGINQN